MNSQTRYLTYPYKFNYSKLNTGKLIFLNWQAKRVSNPQPSVLETDTLPIELLAYLTFYNLINALLNNFSHHTRTNGTATFTNGEA
jgi:hypothetical protein